MAPSVVGTMLHLGTKRCVNHGPIPFCRNLYSSWEEDIIFKEGDGGEWHEVY